MTETIGVCKELRDGKDPGPRDTVCILGMHRSGTSLLTRILNLTGVDLGPDEVLATQSSTDNPKGFWEHGEIMSINIAILQRHGGSWKEPPLLPPGWETAAALDDLRHQAQQLIHDHFNEAQLWGWKDPRSCLTLPFWQQLVPDMRYILCLRNPADVARSLEQRDGLSEEKSSALWLAYVSAALNHTEGKPRLVVFYEDLMGDWLRELRRLAEFLGKPEQAKQPDVQASVKEFIEQGLQHHRASMVQASASSRIDPRARALYLAQRISVSFGREEINQQPELDNQIYEALDALSQTFQASGKANPLFKQVAELEAEAAGNRETIRGLQARLIKREDELEIIALQLNESEQARETQLVESNATLQALSTELVERDGTVQALSTQLVQKDGILQTLSTQLVQKDGILQTLSTQLVQKDGTLQTLSTQLAEQTRAQQSQAESAEERERVLSDQQRVLSDQLRDTESQLEGIRRTLGWRLLNRYGRIKHKYFLPIFQLINQGRSTKAHEAAPKQR